MWSQMNVRSNECGLKWMWSQMTVASNECGLKWMWSQINVVSNECGLKWMWGQMSVVSNECGLKWLWSQMNVVSNEYGLKLMWSQINRSQMSWSQMNVVANEKVSYECSLKWTSLKCRGLKWTWSQMKWSHTNGLKWIGLNCLHSAGPNARLRHGAPLSSGVMTSSCSVNSATTFDEEALA